MGNLISIARSYVGKQETFGRNDGPNIRRWKLALGPGVAAAPAIPWCAIFVTAMIMEATGKNRLQVLASLGFRPGQTYLESCDSWLSEGRVASPRLALGEDVNPRCVKVTNSPIAGDVGLVMKALPGGRFSTTDAVHIFIVTSPELMGQISTIEGNTVSGDSEGPESREGNGVYERQRVVAPGKFVFLRLPSELVGGAA